MIKLICSNCNHEINAPEKYAGKRVRCPKCKSPVRIPQLVGQKDTQEPKFIKFNCPTCNQKIGVAADHAGKRVRCAKCKNPLRIPQASSQADSSTVKDQTDILRAGQEQKPEAESIWSNVANRDELLLADDISPSTEKQMEQS